MKRALTQGPVLVVGMDVDGASSSKRPCCLPSAAAAKSDENSKRRTRDDNDCGFGRSVPPCKRPHGAAAVVPHLWAAAEEERAEMDAEARVFFQSRKQLSFYA